MAYKPFWIRYNSSARKLLFRTGYNKTKGEKIKTKTCIGQTRLYI